MLVTYIVSLLVGIVVGIITFIFGSGLIFINNVIFKLFPYNLILLPIVAFLTVYLSNMRKSELSGSMNKVFRAAKKDKSLSILIIPYQILTTWLAHLSGASVGREGVAVQLGAVAGNMSKQYAPTVDSKYMTKLGMAAGFAGLFGTPLAATVFCFEVLKDRLKILDIFPILLATLTANFVTSVFGLHHFKFHVEFQMLSIRELILLVFCIVCFLIVGQLFAYLLNSGRNLVSSIKIKAMIKIVAFSIVGALLLYFIGNGRYMSLGTNIIDQAFNDPAKILYLDFFFKSILTIGFVSFGFQGGEVTPLFTIGSSLGVALASLLNLPTATVGALGYGLVFGVSANVVLASSVMIIEVFGIGMIPYVLLALLVIKGVKFDKYTIYPYVK